MGIYIIYTAEGSLSRPLSHPSTLTSPISADGLGTQSPVESCTYLIFKENSLTSAKNCATGVVDFSGNDSSAVLNRVFNEINTAGGGVVYVKGYGANNPYLITSALEIPDSGHLTFTGDGPEFTVLKVPAGYDNNMFEFIGDKKRNSFFNEFRNFEGVGDPSGATNTGFFLNSSSYGVSDSLWFNVFLRDFKHDDIYLGQHNSWNNRIDSCTIELAGRAGLYRSGGIDSSDARIVDTKFLFNRQYGVYDAADFGTYTSNWFYKNYQTAMKIDRGAKTVIADNRFEDNGISANDTYNDLWIAGSFVDVTGNIFYGSEAGGNYIKSAVRIDGNTEKNLIADNVFENGHFGTNLVDVNPASQGTIVSTNEGLSPLGVVQLPLNNTIYAIIPQGGDSSVPKPGASYVVEDSSILLSSEGGIGVSITIRDSNENVVLSGLKELHAQYVPQGYTIAFGDFSSAPSLKIAFN